jgi:hypothetical protein
MQAWSKSIWGGAWGHLAWGTLMNDNCFSGGRNQASVDIVKWWPRVQAGPPGNTPSVNDADDQCAPGCYARLAVFRWLGPYCYARLARNPSGDTARLTGRTHSRASWKLGTRRGETDEDRTVGWSGYKINYCMAGHRAHTYIYTYIYIYTHTYIYISVPFQPMSYWNWNCFFLCKQYLVSFFFN